MRFAHTDLDGELEWTSERRANELVVESPLFLRKLLRELVNHDNKNVCFTENGETINFAKEVDIVYNPLRLDFNNRSVMATLLKMLVKTSLSEEYYLKTNEFKARIVRYLDEIVDSENFIFEISSDDFSIDAIAKAVNLHIVGDEDDYVELLTDYMSMMAELANIKLFVFLNLRAILTDEETDRLCDNLRNHDLNVFLVENRLLPIINGCGRIVVDKDLCEI